MIPCKITTNDGELVFISDSDDLVKLVHERIGFEAAQLVDWLAKSADEVDRRLDTDLNAYESQLDSQQKAFSDIRDSVDSLRYLLEAKRLDRAAIERVLRSIEQELSNQL